MDFKLQTLLSPMMSNLKGPYMRHPNTPSRPGSTVATRLKLFCALLVASVFSAAHAADLILPAPQSAGADRLDKRARNVALTNVLRSRSVGLDFSALDIAADELTIKGLSAPMRLQLFDDTALVVAVVRREATSSKGIAFIGHVPGVPFSTAILVNNGGVVSMHITALNSKYSIYGSPDLGYIVQEVGEHGRPEHPPLKPGALDMSPTKARTAADAKKLGEEEPVTAGDDGTQIDVMVVYTPAAVAAQPGGGTVAQMHANIDAQIALTNTIYANSNVVQRLRLVYKGLVNHTEARDMGVDLTRITDITADPADGLLDDVLVLRNAWGADIVSLWGVYTNYCGVANLMQIEAAGFQAFAYNVVASPSCTASNDYTFAHELGHNMGLRHDNFMDNAGTTVTPEGSGTATPIAFAHGHVDTINRFRTVMAYENQCNVGCNPFDNPCTGQPPCRAIPYFSNPAISFNNIAYYSSAVIAPTGNAANAHEQRALNDTRETTANFRQSVNTAGAGTVAAQFSTYTVAENAGTAQVVVSRHAGSAGAVTLNYATANGSALAGTDYTATSGMLSWAAGDATTRTINVSILDNATASAADENREFTLLLDTPTGGLMILGSPVTFRIQDDETVNWPSACNLPTTGWTNMPAGATMGWSVAPKFFDQTACVMQSNEMGNAAIPGVANAIKAQIQFTGNFVAGNIAFSRVVQSEIGYDCLRFLIDGVQQVFGTMNCVGSGGLGASGDLGLSMVSVPITAGVHTITWSYEKNEAITYLGDAAWIEINKLSFPLQAYALAVAKNGAGSGTVVGPGIVCGGDCAETHVAGIVVSLTATAAGGSAFASWSGCDSVSGARCNATMNAAKGVIATFNTTSTAPGAPTIGTATAGNALAVIAFTVPASNGGSAITVYTATCGAISATGTTSPIAVTGLMNGAMYSCSVTATNAIGTSMPSGTLNVTPSAMAPLTPVAVVSRKTHGAAGTFDLPLDTVPIITGLVTTEPRLMGPRHLILFRFNHLITLTGAVNAVDGGGMAIGMPMAEAVGTDVQVTLTGVPDKTRVTVALIGVNGSLDTAVSLGLLFGDVNNTRTVDENDIVGVKARSGQAVTAANFKYDLNLAGAVNASDIVAVKAKFGGSLP